MNNAEFRNGCHELRQWLLIVTLDTSRPHAQASQFVDLKQSELQAVEFYSRCADQVKTRSYTVKSGNKGYGTVRAEQHVTEI